MTFRLKKTKQEILSLFRRTYNGKRNIMTPILIEVGTLPGGFVYELSRGEDHHWFYPMYGITVLSATGAETDRSEGGFDKEEAYSRLKEMGAERAE